MDNWELGTGAFWIKLRKVVSLSTLSSIIFPKLKISELSLPLLFCWVLPKGYQDFKTFAPTRTARHLDAKHTCASFPSPRMALRFLTTTRLVERRPQQFTPAWALVSCAIVSVGLGYIYSYRRFRKTTDNNNININSIKQSHSGSDDGDIVQTETPHPSWTPGQNQPRPEGLDKGEKGVVFYVRLVSLLSFVLRLGACVLVSNCP